MSKKVSTMEELVTDTVLRIPRPEGYTDWWKSNENALVKESIIPLETREVILSWVRNNFHINGVYTDLPALAKSLSINNHTLVSEYIMEIVNNMSLLSDKDPSKMAHLLFNKAFQGFMVDKVKIDRMVEKVEDWISSQLDSKRKRLDTFALKGFTDLMNLSITINKEFIGMIKTLSQGQKMILVNNTTNIENQQNNIETNDYLTPMAALELLNDKGIGLKDSEGQALKAKDITSSQEDTATKMANMRKKARENKIKK